MVQPVDLLQILLEGWILQMGLPLSRRQWLFLNLRLQSLLLEGLLLQFELDLLVLLLMLPLALDVLLNLRFHPCDILLRLQLELPHQILLHLHLRL
jgi:hypothetical protein